MSRSSHGFSMNSSSRALRADHQSKTMERLDKEIFTPDSGTEWIQIHSMTGLCKTRRGEWIYHLLCFVTFGMFILVCHWFPEWSWLRRYKVVPLHDADFVLVLDHTGNGTQCVVERIGEQTHSDIRLVHAGVQPNRDVSTPLVPITANPQGYDDYQPVPPVVPIPSFPQRLYHTFLDFVLGEARVIPSSKFTPLIQRMIVYRSTRFVYDDDLDCFVRLRPPKEQPLSHYLQICKSGIDSSTHRSLLDLYGRNALTVHVPSFFDLFVQEVMHPFFVFQVYSIILWCFESYFIFATCIAIMALVSVVLTLFTTHAALVRLQKIGQADIPIKVQRNAVLVTVSTLSLVPGDIILVEPGVQVCDSVLVKGRVLVNEAVLTGESAPVTKMQVDVDQQRAIRRSLAAKASSKVQPGDTPISFVDNPNSTLAAGTDVLQVRGKDTNPRGRCLAMVTATGFDTAKGALLLSLLYPKASPFPFMTQALKFIGVLFGVAMVGFGVSVWKFLQFGAPLSLIIIRSFDLITIVVPPSLPLAMAIGTNNALQALRNRGIFCSQPSRVNVAGKIQMCCFDKTGTLTTSTLDLHSVKYVQNTTMEQSSKETAVFASDAFIPNSTPISALTNTLHLLLSTCHGLSCINNTLVGDPLEVSMTEAVRATMVDQASMCCLIHKIQPCTCIFEKHMSALNLPFDKLDTNPSSKEHSGTWLVTKQYPFNSDVMRMSVMVQNMQRERYVLTKGSPEALRRLCLVDSLPEDYDAMVTSYTRKGYRVIAIAGKAMNKRKKLPTTGLRTASPVKAVFPTALGELPTLATANPISESDEDEDDEDEEDDEMEGVTDRSDAESNLYFLGLLVFENPLKEASQATIAELHRHGMRTAMITGDTPLTAFAVAKEVGILKPGRQLFASQLVAQRAMVGPPTELRVKFKSTTRMRQSAAYGSMNFSNIDTLRPPEPQKSLNNTSQHGIMWGSGYGSRSISKSIVTVQHLRQFLQFQHVLVPSQYLDPVSLKPFYIDSGKTAKWGWDPEVDWVVATEAGDHTGIMIDDYMPYELALTGNVISHLLADHSAPAREYLLTLFYSTSVFSRVSPELKAYVVESLMSLGLYVSMCGDGANDAPALKVANIGLSLSDTEASVAAPFTSKIQDISSIIPVLCQGRGALDTCFMLFRYMALYSIIQFSCCIFLYMLGSNQGDKQFLVHDMLLVFPLVVLLGEMMANDKLTDKRPSSNLLSVPNQISVFSHMIICVIFQGIAYFQCSSDPAYVVLPNENFGSANWQVTTLYYQCNFQYLLIAVIFSSSSQWKKDLTEHTKLMAWIIFAGLVSLFMLLGTTSSNTLGLRLFGVNKWSDVWLFTDDIAISTQLRYTVLYIFLGNVLVSSLHEYYVLPIINKALDVFNKRTPTNTDYGVGGLVLQGFKGYHVLRRRFENNWYPNGRPTALKYGTHVTTTEGVDEITKGTSFYDSFACYGNDDAVKPESITMLPRRREFNEMIDNERVTTQEIADAEMQSHLADIDYGQLVAHAEIFVAPTRGDDVTLGTMTYPLSNSM